MFRGDATQRDFLAFQPSAETHGNQDLPVNRIRGVSLLAQ
jgi:hypothetical protein